VTLLLRHAPRIREGRTVLSVRLDGGGFIRTHPARIGTLDDGGLGVTLGVCEAEDGSAEPCLPELLVVPYNAECARSPKVKGGLR
jgi:hypothetical protein